jgi:hypothetical protein
MDKNYKGKIVYESELNLSLMNRTKRGIALVKRMKRELKEGDIWVIKFWGAKINLKPLVDFLFYHKLDVFDVEYGSVTRIYVCKMDSYRIKNSVVYNVYGVKKNELMHTNTQ